MKRSITMVMMCVALSLFGQAHAESVRRGDPAAAAAVQQLQQVSTERDSLLASQQELKAESERRTKELSDAKAKLLDSTNEIARLKAQLGESARAADRAGEASSATAEKLKDTQERLQKVVEKYKELVNELRSSEERVAALELAAGKKGDSLTQCIKDNRALHDATQDLIRKYEEKGVWDALLQREPVTQIKRVEVESMAELYRDEAARHVFQPQADASTPE